MIVDPIGKGVSLSEIILKGVEDTRGIVIIPFSHSDFIKTSPQAIGEHTFLLQHLALELVLRPQATSSEENLDASVINIVVLRFCKRPFEFLLLD